MQAVGIRNLKNSLSRYLKMVQSGERIIITDHNKIVAEIVPTSASDARNEILSEYVAELTEAGKLIPANTRVRLRRKRSEKGIVDQRTVEYVYRKTRDDRA